MAFPCSAAYTQPPYLYRTLTGTVAQMHQEALMTQKDLQAGEPVIQAGVNFTCLRGFLPKNTNLEASLEANAGNDLDLTSGGSLSSSLRVRLVIWEVTLC